MPQIPRTKNPVHDLKRDYNRTLSICVGITFTLHVGIVVVFPTFLANARRIERLPIVIETVDIPETRQIKRSPPPPRPTVPIATESTDVPDDVTIETTDLDLERISIVLPPAPSEAMEDGTEEEVIEFFKVEKKPQIIKQVPPGYPVLARKAGIEGTVILKVLVDKDGSVAQATVVKGKSILEKAALQAIYQYRFSPGLQNDKPVKVWLIMPILFQLVD